jgi:hypothetical protein
MEVSGQLYTPTTLPLGENPSSPRVGGSQCQSGRFEERKLLRLVRLCSVSEDLNFHHLSTENVKSHIDELF